MKITDEAKNEIREETIELLAGFVAGMQEGTECTQEEAINFFENCLKEVPAFLESRQE